MFDPQYPGECSNLTNYKERVKTKSYIRKEKYCPATTTAMYVTLRLPPLDSETGWTEELWSKKQSLLLEELRK